MKKLTREDAIKALRGCGERTMECRKCPLAIDGNCDPGFLLVAEMLEADAERQTDMISRKALLEDLQTSATMYYGEPGTYAHHAAIFASIVREQPGG